ncbi:MAG: hypothetical protein V4539_10905 [Bacteroidota bacterium]
MKTVVSVNEISEFEIKPKAELAEWKRLVEHEMSTHWADKSSWIKVSCPVCSKDEPVTAFNKSGFAYVECNHCKTLYAQTRPSANEMGWWYTGSGSTAFWKKQLLQSSAESRDAKIIEPRANWVVDGLSEYLSGTPFNKIHLTDISFFGKALVEKIAAYANGISIVSAGLTDGEVQYQPGTVQKNTIGSIDDFYGLQTTDVMVAIDVLERLSSIDFFLRQMETTVKPGGLIFATCPVASGFEIQSLWERSPSIIPPDKLNLPSVKGLIDLFTSNGKWKILELSTPGMFDVDVVKQTMSQYPDQIWPRSLHALVDAIDKQGIAMFTEYLQSQRLSSFARIVLRREENK